MNARPGTNSGNKHRHIFTLHHLEKDDPVKKMLGIPSSTYSQNILNIAYPVCKLI